MKRDVLSVKFIEVLESAVRPGEPVRFHLIIHTTDQANIGRNFAGEFTDVSIKADNAIGIMNSVSYLYNLSIEEVDENVSQA
nr:MAG: hypothetical protein [Microviridae sp.]